MAESRPEEPTPSQTINLNRLEKYLLEKVQGAISGDVPSPAEYRQTIARLLEQAYASTDLNLDEDRRSQVIEHVLNEMVGYGPIQPLLDDPGISEIMVVGPKSIYYERNGELFDTDLAFENEAHVLRIIDRMIHPMGRRVDEDNPAVDARLPDGSRVHVVIPPVAVDGPYITIRKFLPNRMSIQELIALGTLTENMAEFLRACVAARLNIVISGGTSSGKTTLLNVLSSFIPSNERIITIEDAVELQLKQKHVVRLETRNPSTDGTGAMNTRALVRNALRMRPDRIIVGEVRSGEALDMLQGMNTGHSGSLTTLHANTPRDTITRLETMCMMAGLDIPLMAIRKQIASAIHLIVHLTRMEDGSRKTTQITEVAGMESNVVTLTDIFEFEQSGIDEKGKIEGQLKATGIRPLFSPKLEMVGYKLSGKIFGADQVKWNTRRTTDRRR